MNYLYVYNCDFEKEVGWKSLPGPFEIYSIKSFVISTKEHVIKVWSGHPNESWSDIAFKKLKYTLEESGIMTIQCQIDEARTEELNK